MREYNEKFVSEFKEFTKTRKPNFNNLIKVLNKECPERFTLFEFFMNDEIYKLLSEYDYIPDTEIEYYSMRIQAFRNAGYDYCTLPASDFHFTLNVNQHGKESRSMNDNNIIVDRESYNRYIWNDPENFDSSRLLTLEKVLPEGMKIIVNGPGGVLENAISLLGYENMCYLLSEDPELLREIFYNIGSRLVKYYEIALQYNSVGACISNDDWGFNTQTMLSPSDMNKYVFKWHKKIVETIHSAGRPAILHSCGQLSDVYDNIINDMKYDAKHSYEDNILPVEKSYDMLNPRIAVLGGIDLDFVCRATPKEVYDRACAMLKKTSEKGGYALGTGNSVPHYAPYENYIAMISAAIVK